MCKLDGRSPVTRASTGGALMSSRPHANDCAAIGVRWPAGRPCIPL